MIYNDGVVEFIHQTARQLRQRIQFETFFKFSIVRNPLDRMISEYFFSKQYRPYLLKKDLNFDEYVKAVSELDTSVLPHLVANHLYTQFDFLYDENGKRLVDYVGRFEKLQESVDEIGKRINQKIVLPHLNKSERVDLKYSQSTVDLVQKMYFNDYIHFGYNFM